tara:strand:+ start:7541 stop:8284 length:744 start_codon:yes stop_codon:yes gene_type:complete
MAINVNTVYTTVLSILNKEQRGYLTPDEFNKVATQVQLEIFEKMFDDYTQFLRMPKLDAEFASKVDHTYEEIQIFEETKNADSVTGNVYDQPFDLHRLGSAFYNNKVTSPEISILDKRSYTQQILSPILQPSKNFPIATYQKNKLTVYPIFENPDTSDITFNYIRKPKDVVWAYGIGDLDQYIWDEVYDGGGTIIPSSGSQNFELSETFQTEVILEVLKYSGVIIKDPQIIQAASQELQANEANQKR